MSLGHGASIVRDGLVFQYDMANTSKSWKGKPTTNLIPFSSLATDTKVKTGDYYGTYKGILRTGIANDNPRTYWFNSSATVNASTTYTLSCLYWSSDGVLDDVYLRFTDTGWPESNNYIQPFTSQSVTRNGSFTVTDIGDNWKYCVGTFDTLATTTTLNQCFFDVDVAGRDVFITNVQFEQGSFPTPFVNGTRSNTQALLDISKGGNTITASDVTYNSDGTFQFNGSSNWATSSSFYLGSDPVFSVEMWIKRTSSFSSAGYWGLGGGSSGNGVNSYNNPARANKIGWDLWGLTTFDTGQDYPLNEWVHVVWAKIASSFTTSTLKVYINGVDTPLSYTARNGGSTVNLVDGFTFGRISDNVASYYAPGIISQCSVYNRELSGLEVKRNFNAHRNRYGV